MKVRGAAELLDSFLERGVIEPWPDPEASSMANYERVIGSAVLRGEIDSTEALRALELYEAWQLAGEPKVGNGQ